MSQNKVSSKKEKNIPNVSKSKPGKKTYVISIHKQFFIIKKNRTATIAAEKRKIQMRFVLIVKSMSKSLRKTQSIIGFFLQGFL